MSVDSAQLKGLFKQAGSVKMTEVIYDKSLGRSRGFGFVTMSSLKEVEAAVGQFHGYVVQGKSLRVNPSLQRGPKSDANKVFVGNLSSNVDELALTKLFCQQGEVLDAHIVYDKERRSRGFGFVTYGSAAEVEKATLNLHGASLHGRKIRVNAAHTKPPMLQ